jgi:hypothetical protein
VVLYSELTALGRSVREATSLLRKSDGARAGADLALSTYGSRVAPWKMNSALRRKGEGTLLAE